MKATKTYKPLTAYHVSLSNGKGYNTNMAADVTLRQAREYFMGREFEQADGTVLKCVDVSPAQ